MERQKGERGRFRVYALVCTLIGFGFVFLSFVYTESLPLESRIVGASFFVSDHVGIDVDDRILAFGSVTPDGSSTRHVLVRNEYSFPLFVRVGVSENLRDIVVYEESFVLSVGEQRSLPFVLHIPRSYSFGEYSGTVRFIFYQR